MRGLGDQDRQKGPTDSSFLGRGHAVLPLLKSWKLILEKKMGMLPEGGSFP